MVVISSVVMTELLVPWSSTLVGLFLELGCTSAETSSIVMESIATAALHGNTLVISEWHKNLESLFCKLGYVSGSQFSPVLVKGFN